MPEKHINRQVHYIYAPAFVAEDTSGINNSWIYHRAQEGYLFELVAVQFSTSKQTSQNVGIVAIYDGHEYTHWNIFPGVESRELLAQVEVSHYEISHHLPLFDWLCKEYTIGIRSATTEHGFKPWVIVWYYLKKASRDELLEYALKHPKDEDAFKRALRGRTADTEEL